MKRICSILLIVLMLLSLMAACSTPGDDTKTPEQNDPVKSPEDETTATEPAFPEPDIPADANFNGINFNVLYPFWGAFETQLFGDEETEAGAELDDAIWKRNKKIEDTVNIRFNPIVRGMKGEDTIKKILPDVRKSVLAGDGAYDLVLIHPMCDLNTYAQGQLVRNWKKMPYVDLTKPYWNQSMNDTLAINGILLFAANDFIIPSPTVVLFNKKILGDYGMDDPYGFVRNGTWAWGKFSDMAKQVTKDLDGNGIFDENDLYGLTLLLDGSGMISMMHACGQFITKKGEGDIPELDLMNEKLVNLIEKIYDLTWVGNQTYTWTYDVWADLTRRDIFENFFARGHALFAFNSPSTTVSKELRAMEVDFGILPYPKYDEAQKEYISLNSAGLMCVPSDVKDPDMVGMVAELLGSESRRYTIPTYYDVLLTHKGVRDDDSLEMLDIIFKNTVYDFGYCYSNFTNIAYIVPRLIADKSKDVASFYEKNAKTFEKDLQKAYENIMKYEDLDY